MNERIKQLAVEAGFYANPDVEKFEKFAELFVWKCVEQLRYTLLDTQELRQDKSTDYQVGWEDGMFDAAETIKDLFGVE
jgi:hypothetical protein